MEELNGNNNNTAPNMNPGTPDSQKPSHMQQEAPSAVVPPTPPQAPTQDQNTAPAPKSGGKGPMVGIAVIIILLIFGGLYFWGASLNSAQLNEDTIFDEAANNDIAAPSDEPAQIESDLDTFNTDDFEAQLDADLEALEAEL